MDAEQQQPLKPGQAPPQLKGRLLSTMNEDGSRRWLKPWLSKGAFWKKRRVVAYALIATFTLVPHIKMPNGVPLLLLDVQRKEFNVLGGTFLPNDMILMALLIISIFLTIFMVTALFGRVWCGWACPQTVYMEFLYRPIERFFDGDPAKRRRGKKASPIRQVLKYIVFFLCSIFLAHTFLAYFVPPAELITWVTRSPFEHSTAFLVMFITTGLMLFDFCFFREQMCTIACPYGRFQAAMLDKQSLIIAYDEKRGEPRGKGKRRNKSDVSLNIITEEPGDCIDCHKCVTTCPTGIDIRDGLQMECIGCAQCIDACDDVMERINKPKGLIRYSSQAIMSGEAKRFVRPRMFVYPSVVAVLLAIFMVVLVGRTAAEANILPRQGSPYYDYGEGQITNQARIRVFNRSDQTVTYTFSLAGIEDASIMLDDPTLTLDAGQTQILGFSVLLPTIAFADSNRANLFINIVGSDGYEKTLRYPVLGPDLVNTEVNP
ncbi:MAG: cytochrome c oxidase accessory protein CcoG [Planctomycetota bacterium]